MRCSLNKYSYRMMCDHPLKANGIGVFLFEDVLVQPYFNSLLCVFVTNNQSIVMLHGLGLVDKS